MIGQGNTKNFTHALVLLAKLFPHLQDSFFVQKLQDKISNLITAYVLICQVEGAGVAQYEDARQNFLNVLKNTEEFIDDIRHFKLVPITPLSFAYYGILLVKRQMTNAPVPAEPKTPETKTVKTVIPAVTASDALRPANRLKPIPNALNVNQEKILDFVRKLPRARTKEIVDEFSLLSQRTVKRNLKDLVGYGLLRRESHNKAVFYSAKRS